MSSSALLDFTHVRGGQPSMVDVSGIRIENLHLVSKTGGKSDDNHARPQ